MSIEYVPYCYLIGWSKLDTWYYGVEYAKNTQRVANPANLWSTYFTSSRHVKNFVQKHGDPDVIQVRKTFSSRTQAQYWEHTVLRRMKIRLKQNWLNVNPGGFGFAVPTGELHPCFGKMRSEETKRKQSKTRKQRYKQGLYSYNNHTPEQLEKIRQTGKNNAKPKEVRTYTCGGCGIEVQKTEYAHHPINTVYRCKHCKPGRPPAPVSVDNQIYPSEQKAADSLNLTIHQIRHRLGSPKYPTYFKIALKTTI